VPAMAAATTHLGFGVTVTLSYEPPFPFARRMSTLDHLTNGRIGWNVVTGYLDSAAKGAGQSGQRGHDDRYAVAEDYMQVVYKLWEGSWADDAVIADAESGVFTQAQRVRKVQHDGPHFKLDALHLSEPSPQRTPVLYQAGTSPAGRAFAARHAECVFMSGPSKKIIAPRVAAIRKLAAELGRDPQEILMFAMMTVIVAPTDAEAHARHAEYKLYADPEGALTLMSGWTGVDFSRFAPDQIVEHVESEAGRSALENITRADPDRRWTVREVAEHVSIGGISPVLVGSPATVADALEAWMDETDLDGFNLTFVVRPETFETVADLLVPELQRRGRYKTAYAEGTLREKLLGRARLGARHPAAEYRWA
jgi:FMN-dependent oxidoreductase (nitrilotriacetate monooxygenase family)